ncbi:DUF3540 domain-containing protein [Serratia bockelmannii]|uniref:DUF3540 domain-containing protein n=1 Tax=Serratia bockelmannii TaxID=2703793 RepID=UPI003CEEDC77
MRFSIVKNKSGQVPPQSSCDFLPPGGTIGRSVDNNLVLPDEERAISRLQAIVHISADGECRITNRGNVTRVLLNDIPLERGRQVELQDGDVLGIDDYQIEVSALHQHAAPQAQPVAKAAAVAAAAAPTAAAKEKSAAPIPNEIWDSLVEEFTPNAPAAVTPPPVANPDSHPLLETPARELNPADPLAQLAGDVDLRQLQQQQTDPAALFNTDTTFEREHILADTTPSALLAEQAAPPRPAPPVQNAQQPEQELDPLALFGGSSAPASPETLNSNDPLGLLMGGAVPLAQPEAPRPQPTPPPVQTPEPQPQPAPQFSQQEPPAQPPRPRQGNRLALGDNVLVAGCGHQLWAIAVLERAEPQSTARLCVAGDLQIETPNGSLSLHSAQALKLSGDAMTLQANSGDCHVDKMKYSGEELSAFVSISRLVGKRCESLWHSVSQISHSLFRKVRQTEHVRAGQLDYQAEDYARIHARNTLITSKDITKLDSEQIHVG